MTRPVAVIVDASLAVKWLVPEEDSDLALRLANSWAAAGIRRVAHRWFPVEVASALHKRVLRGELSPSGAAALIDDLSDYEVILYDRTPVHYHAFRIAAELRQRWIYDSFYLALAIELDCPLWTADRNFFHAAIQNYPQIHYITEAETTPNT